VRYLRLLAIFAGTELQFAAEYRVNLLLDLFEEAVIVVSSLAAVLILFSHTGVINGWTLAQMIVLLGVYYIIQGANSVMFEASFERFMEHVRLGTLDFILIKPANSQFLASARHVQVAQLGQLLIGMGPTLGNTEANEVENHRALALVTKERSADRIDFASLKVGEPRTVSGPLEWVAVKSKYFVTAVFGFDSTGGAIAVLVWDG